MNKFNAWALTGVFVPNAILAASDVSCRAKLVYAKLLQGCDSTGISRPKQTQMAAELGMNVKTLRKAITELVKAAYVQIDKAAGQDRFKSREHAYSFNWTSGINEIVNKTNNLDEPPENHTGGLSENHTGGLPEVHMGGSPEQCDDDVIPIRGNGNGVGGVFPVAALIDMYNVEFAGRKGRDRVVTLSPSSRRYVQLRTRWREHPDLEWWRGVFKRAAQCDIPMGKALWWPKGFNLDQFTRPDKLDKLLNGEYDPPETVNLSDTRAARERYAKVRETAIERIRTYLMSCHHEGRSPKAGFAEIGGQVRQILVAEGCEWMGDELEQFATKYWQGLRRQ